jgi:serine/threonine-protein kinase
VKACPTCGRLYPTEAGFCAVDGSELRSATQVPVQASDDARVGTMVAMRYQIRRVVADGGMGRVYEALDMQQGRRVALKLLHSDVASDQVAVERFKREFEVSSLLPHDHIVEVLDFQQEGTSYILAMEFLDGEELRTVLKREKIITPGRLVRMMSQLAIGLDPAHSNQLIHRDLKPDNVFLCGTREGDLVKLLDFGSVKDKSSKAKKLTVMGTTIGSPFYMAPEQAQALDTLDHRADVWALAAIAYEAVTGSVPFMGANGPAILLAILTKEPVAPSVLGKGAPMPVPPTLDEVMSEAFAKNPAYRTKSAGALAERIGRAYGLEGDHRTWAVTPQHVLDAKISEAMPELLRKTSTSIGDPFAMSDPFANPPPGGARPAAAGAGVAAIQPPVSMESAFSNQRAPMEPDVAAGVPTSGLPIALIAGGVVILIVLVLVIVLVAMK